MRFLQGPLLTHHLLVRVCSALFSWGFLLFFFSPKGVLLSKSTWEGGFRLSTETGFFLLPCFPKTVIQTTLIAHYFLSELPPWIIYPLLV